MGMTLKTRPEDIYRALVEATAYGTRKIIENYTACGIAIDEVIISGGIARKNPFIMQIYADVLGKPIRIAGSRQNAALSSAIWAAYAAGEANGGYSSLEEAVGHMAAPIVRTYEPDETAKPVYDILYQEYGRLHDVLWPRREPGDENTEDVVGGAEESSHSIIKTLLKKFLFIFLTSLTNERGRYA